MANVITPSQTIYLDPHRKSPFNFRNFHSKTYHSYHVNKLFHVLGENVILNGMDFKTSVIDENGNVTLIINPGMVIVNSRLIHFTEEITLSIDISNYSINGCLVVSLSYLSTNNINPMQAGIKLSYISSSGVAFPDYWWFNGDTLLIGYLTFSKSPYALVDLTPALGAPTFNVTIEGDIYPVVPYDNISLASIYTVNPNYEIYTITEDDYEFGVFELSRIPITGRTVDIEYIDSGLSLSNKWSYMIPVESGYEYVEDPNSLPDYDIQGKSVYFRNMPGFISNLSDDINVGDVLKIRYQPRQ